MKNQRAYKKKKKRVARGSGSGHGKTACRGNKGYYSRTGSKQSPGFEGGQMPFIRRMPKRGFNNAAFKKDIIIVNVSDFAMMNVKDITPQALCERGIIKNAGEGVKVLGTGACPKGITVHAHHFSAQAKNKIEAAGGKVVVLTK